MSGYAEFELDIPGVMRGQLPSFFETLQAETLIPENVAKIPERA
jgi:hypothetical protein